MTRLVLKCSHSGVYGRWPVVGFDSQKIAVYYRYKMAGGGREKFGPRVVALI